MATCAIRVDGVSKRYRIGGRQPSYATLRDTLADAFTAPFRRAGAVMRGELPDAAEEEIWALREISFEVQAGDVIGVIGRNGAGKSTLLKVLSRITEPTEGYVGINGRVGSLLEVGTGFHAELTGRDNIYLNGAILGMRRTEIDAKFDEIVAFAEIERFLDTPVKRYSSGMYMRLAFAVAAHLDPEILLVDEVLAVGDTEFQKKCLGKMGDVARQGRTVLFVSHNMAAIGQLCPTTVWLDAGRVADAGATPSMISRYLRSGVDIRAAPARALDPNKEAQFVSARCVNAADVGTRAFCCDDAIEICIAIHVQRETPGLYAACDILRIDGTRVLKSYSSDSAPDPLSTAAPGSHEILLTIPPRLLGHGEYAVEFSLAQAQGMGAVAVDAPGAVCGFSIEETVAWSGNQRPGLLSTLIPWRTRALAR